MKPLLRQLTRFVETALELYAPLPFEFTADLHTLNAYLRSYSEAEEKPFEGFVNRLVEKLEEKTRLTTGKEAYVLPTSASESFDHALRHYNSCTFKYPELRLNLDAPEELNATQALQDRPVYSQRSQRSEEGGIKANRHKFGSKHRSKLNDLSIDKENLSFNFNSDAQDKTLRGIRSELELPGCDHRKKSADISLRGKEEGRAKGRYESNDGRSSNTSSLKIKLKPRQTMDLWKLREGLDLALQLFSHQEDEISELTQFLLPAEEFSG